ncbi:unnamed protein product [Lasius platythorax]|uniref:Uncharacterized protein n=1 Tax=Lasius platythorax TaxID=488582 RepID=A0AAV2P569_9HYME
MRDGEKRRRETERNCREDVAVSPRRVGFNRGIRYYSPIALTVLVSGEPPRQVCRNHCSNDMVRTNITGTSNVGQRKRQRLANDPVEHG